MRTCLFVLLQELNELVQTLINIHESITGNRPDLDPFIEANKVSKGLLRSFQFTLQVTFLRIYCTMHV